jgi:glycosyltransferase involved in cell wall biosynthesis
MTEAGGSRVDILLATYNGARFLDRQIESILDHLQPGRRLLVRDDGSSDGTMSILQRFSERHPEYITLLADGGERLGPSKNFGRLLERADADYIMFCDQDDVWLPSRISKPLERMQVVEEKYGRDTPLLVHTDLAVVDENLQPLASSFWKYSRIDPRTGDRLSRLLVRNVVTGCATTINRALARRAYPIPTGAVMHDWWLALVAAGCGRVEYLPEATVLYRQHSNNAIGARRWRWTDAPKLVLQRLKTPGAVGELGLLSVQARALLVNMKPHFPRRNLVPLEVLANLDQRGFFERRIKAVRHGLVKYDWAANLAWLALL